MTTQDTQDIYSENLSTSYEMKDIGNIIKLREEIDPEQRITKHIRSHLSVTDLMPTTYKLVLGNIDSGNWAIHFDPDPAIKEFKLLCKQYGLRKEASGLRLWLTDDTVAADSISNNYYPNVIETGIENFAGSRRTLQSIRTLEQFSRSTGDGSTPYALLKAGEDFTTDVAKSLVREGTSYITDKVLAGEIESAANSLVDTAGGIIFHGKKLSLPKIWNSTTYSPSLTLTIKLISPYGHPTAIKNFVTEPLIYLLLLASPCTKDGITFGLPRSLYIAGYGSSSINLGYIESVHIRRGGRETAYNIFKQPLVLDVNITLKPLSEGFACVDVTKKDFVTMESADICVTSDPPTSRPSITTVGNIIHSLRPAPVEVIAPNYHSEMLRSGREAEVSYLEGIMARPHSSVSGALDAL